ncbi:hypothetical protein BDN70DRAFT_919965 [Pholiota conissans]|uniref:DUF829-domain-containing protein n=1 Tax=Pholiota conissans TaxID=109636 RepID=A0A9P6D2B8_9AGAR|nr:hypothetical protein BDN70DRAFT_919965 [Pholiota conissans]
MATPPKKLGHPDVLLFEADSNSREAKDTDTPSLIVLFGWMDATMPLLMKYIQRHKALFPGADIALVRINANFMLTGEVQRYRILTPLAKMILEKVYYASESKGVLFHVISNGGGFQLIYLSTLLTRLLRTTPPPPPSPQPPHQPRIALVIDSAPGSGDFSSMVKTFAVPFSSSPRVAKTLLFVPVALLYAAYLVQSVVRGLPPLMPLLRERLAQPGVVPLRGVQGEKDEDGSRAPPRVYVFSDRDGMVDERDVLAHLREVERKGMVVRRERFVGSGHVEHMKTDPERYWGAVRAVWEEAGKARVRAKL